MLNRFGFESEVLWTDFKCSDIAALRFGHIRPISNSHFIKTVGTMNYPRVLNSKPDKDTRHRFDKRPMPYANYLSRRTRRVGQRPKQVKSRVHAQLSTNACDARGRSMIKRREHKTDSYAIETTLGHLRRRTDVDAKSS